LRPRCGNNSTSCGSPGHCVDLTGAVYCVRGRIVQTKCLSNNIRNETLTSSCDGGDYKITIKNSLGGSSSANITMYSAGSSKIIGRSSVTGEGSINSLENLADMEFDFRNSEFNFLIKGTNLSNLPTSREFIIDKVNATIAGTTVFKAFHVELPQGFAFSSIILKIRYSDVTINENNITLYKCSNFTNACNSNWQKISIIKDSAKRIAIAEVSSFSAYALGDPGSNTTTTTTTVPNSTTTTTTTTVPNSTTTTTTTTTVQDTDDYGSGSDYYTSEPESTTTIETTITETETPEVIVENVTNSTVEIDSKPNLLTAFMSMPSNYALVIPTLAVVAGSLIFKMIKQNGEYKTKYYPGAAKFKKMKKQHKKVKGKRSSLVLHL